MAFSWDAIKDSGGNILGAISDGLISGVKNGTAVAVEKGITDNTVGKQSLGGSSNTAAPATTLAQVPQPATNWTKWVLIGGGVVVGGLVLFMVTRKK